MQPPPHSCYSIVRCSQIFLLERVEKVTMKHGTSKNYFSTITKNLGRTGYLKGYIRCFLLYLVVLCSSSLQPFSFPQVAATSQLRLRYSTRVLTPRLKNTAPRFCTKRMYLRGAFGESMWIQLLNSCQLQMNTCNLTKKQMRPYTPSHMPLQREWEAKVKLDAQLFLYWAIQFRILGHCPWQMVFTWQSCWWDGSYTLQSQFFC